MEASEGVYKSVTFVMSGNHPKSTTSHAGTPAAGNYFWFSRVDGTS